MIGNGDYISREAALDVMCEILCDGRENCDENTYCCSAKLMKSIPAADVRPVVFCKDCKWYQIDELKKDGTEDRRYKPSVCVLAEQRRDPNHFCADGAMLKK